MSRPLQVLVVEDGEADAMLIVQALRSTVTSDRKSVV